MLYQTNGICPVCRTTGKVWCKTMDWEYRTTYDVYTYLKCPSCQTLFIKEILLDNLLTFYPPNYYSFSKKAGGTLFRLKNWWDQRFYKSLLKSIPSSTLSVLDIGGGTGEVLDTIKTADKRVSYCEIIDIDQGSKNKAEKKGYVYTLSTIEDYETEKKFEVILLLNIIEHISNPVTLIEKAGKMLTGDGIIIIKTPNADSLDAKLFRKFYWGGLHCPRHWIVFTDHSFLLMLKPFNFSHKKIVFTQGAPFWTYSVLNLFRKKRIQEKKNPLIEHVLFAPLSIFFALIDICRSPFAKTSQMFIILGK